MTIAEVAQLASALAVIIALVFGILQLRHMGKTRALAGSTELVRAIQTLEFARSVRLVLGLPDQADPELIRNDSEMTAAVFYLGHVYESLGVLVFHRILPLHLVDDLMGGYLRQSYAKLGPYLEFRRQELGVSYAEWMEWLAERLIAHPSPGKSKGAHIAHRNWRP